MQENTCELLWFYADKNFFLLSFLIVLKKLYFFPATSRRTRPVGTYQGQAMLLCSSEDMTPAAVVRATTWSRLWLSSITCHHLLGLCRN